MSTHAAVRSQIKSSATVQNDRRLPHLALDTRRVGQSDQFDVWREYNQTGFDVSRRDMRAEGFGASVHAWRTKRAVFADVKFAPLRTRRTSSHIRLLEEGHLLLRYYKEGSARCRIGDKTVTCRPGEVHIFDYCQEMQAATDHVHQVCVYIPHSTISYDPARHPSHLCLQPASALGRVMQSALSSALEQLPCASTDDGNDIDDSVTGIIGSILSTRTLDEGTKVAFDRARNRAMRSFIRDNIRDPELGVHTLLRNFGASRATIYRVFDEDGGIARYIANQRLEHAFWALAGSIGERGSIQTIAEECGFTEASNFARSFRREFGFPPSDLLSQRPHSLAQAEIVISQGETDCKRQIPGLWDWVRAA